MSIFQFWLLIGAVTVAALSWRLEHAWLWIGAGAASFVASTAWGRYDLPMAPLFTAFCDAVVCLLIYGVAKRVWELKLYRLFQASVLVSLVYFGLVMWWPAVASKATYVTILEIINWLALALILGTGATQWISANGRDHSLWFGRDLVRHLGRALLTPRPARPFWEN